MATHTLIWTALPNGVRDGRLQLSALVSPRLVAAATEGDTLSLWPVWENWTALVRDATFKVAFAGGPTIDAIVDRSKLEPDLWRALFKPDTFVRSHAIDNYSGRPIISYPARRVYRSIKRLYQEAGTRAPEGITPTPLSWDVEYIDVDKGDQPTAQILGFASSGRFIYATHQAYTPATPDTPAHGPFGKLVKIDSETRAIVAEVGVGDGPRSVAVMPDRHDPSKNRIYVVNGGQGKLVNGVKVGGYSLMIIRESGNTFEPPLEITLGQVPIDVAVSFARNHVYVANVSQRKLHILDADSGKQIGEFTPDLPDEENLDIVAVIADETEGAVYVAIAEGAGLQPPPHIVRDTRVVKLVSHDGTTYTRAWRRSLPPMHSMPARLAIDPERRRLFVTRSVREVGGPPMPGLTVLDTATGAVAAVSDIPGRLTLNVAASAHFRYAYALRALDLLIVGPGQRVIDTIAHDLRGNLGAVAVLPETEQIVAGFNQDSRIMIATPSSTTAPDDLDDLMQSWDVPWTAEAAQAARDNLHNADVAERDLTARVLLFHRRPPEDAVQLPQTEEDRRRLLDFHEVLSSLGDYPEIMRRLGLIVDLSFPVIGTPIGNRMLRVLPTLPAAPGPAPMHQSPATAARWDGTSFVAASQSGEIKDGLLALDDERYELQQLDLDGAALKLVNAAATLGRVQPGDMLRKALPALRTSGIGLIRSEHAAALGQQFTRSIDLDNTLAEQGDAATVLFAEDLVRGYRVDVWDATSNAWHSLSQRVGTYTFGANGETITRTATDEGLVDISVSEAAAPQPGAPSDLYLHEALTVWNGWSQAARRPGRHVDQSGQPQEDQNEPVTPFKLHVDFTAAPGSLPRLRFGESYRVRARVVDLAGNSPGLDSAPDIGLPRQPGRFTYVRFEPVAAPAVVLRTPITEQTTPGEALERLVLRTSNTDPAADSAPSAARAERHIVAPRASQLFAETHGAIDRQGQLQLDAYMMLAQRDAGQFAVDPATDMPVEGIDRLELPYLADPLSRGATLRDLPGAPVSTVGTVRNDALVYEPLSDGVARRGSATQLGWDAAWPELQPFRIVVRDGAGPPEWSGDTRVLTIRLPKGEIAHVPLSSFMGEDDLKLMAVWHWLREYADEETRRIWERVDLSDPDALDRLVQQIAESAHYAVYGGHGMLTPARELVLVHAVQQPLGRPVWDSLRAERNPAATAIRIAGGLQIHGKSTGSVQLRARWEEPIDNMREGPPAIRPSQAVLLDIPIPRPAAQHDPNKPFVSIRIGGRRVARYYAAQDRLAFVEGAQPEHALADTRHRVIRYRAAATSSFREYFPREAAGGFERESDEVVVRVPSGARPAAPRVRYVVPTFGWERGVEGNLLTSRRRGYGLRVYLDRPWYSSGVGELLGVVIWPRSLSDQDRVRLKGSISQAGADPVAVSSGRTALNQLSFGSPGITWGKRLALPGLTETVDVAGHPVRYDAARDLWYCDIMFDPNINHNTQAYGGFVRLALVRFQPDSLEGLELSRPVTTEFMQVAPDRSAIATYDPLDPGSIRLVVAGQTYRATHDERGQTRPDGTFVQVSVEAQRPDVRNELGWTPAEASLVSITADALNTSDSVLWQGRITLPADRQPGQFRLLIKEFEPWLDDAALGSLSTAQVSARARRLVYAETIVV